MAPAQSRWFRYQLTALGIERYPGIGNQVYVRGNGGSRIIVWNGGDMISYIEAEEVQALMTCMVMVPRERQQALHNKFAKCLHFQQRTS